MTSFKDASRELEAAQRAASAAAKETNQLAEALSGNLSTSLDRLTTGSVRLSDYFRTLALSMAQTVLRSATKPLFDFAGQAITGLFPFEKGGVIDAGKVRAFAKGGVVTQATRFSMRGGTGLMGEAGPEAIMPLARDGAGRLGVRSGQSAASNVNITIQTPDIQGFERSRAQVAAHLARAVGAGRRNL